MNPSPLKSVHSSQLELKPVKIISSTQPKLKIRKHFGESDSDQSSIDFNDYIVSKWYYLKTLKWYLVLL